MIDEGNTIANLYFSYSVRRDEMLSRESSSPSPSPPPESSYQDAHQRLGELLNIDTFITPDQPSIPSKEQKPEQSQGANENQPDNAAEDEEEEFEFRLFSAPTKKPTTTSGDDKSADSKKTSGAGDGTQKLRIRLRSPTPTPANLGDGRLVNPFRGWQYYFTTEGLYSGSLSKGGEESDEVRLRRAQFENVAVSGQDMMGWAKQAWVGSFLFFLFVWVIFCWLDETDICLAWLPSPLAGDSSEKTTYKAPPSVQRCRCLYDRSSGKSVSQDSQEARQEASCPATQASHGRRRRQAKRSREAQSQKPREKAQTETKGTRGKGSGGCCSRPGSSSR